MRDLRLFTGRANPQLARGICQYLDIELGCIDVSDFSDGEIFVQIRENVRGKDVFLLQPTCHPVNQHLMELLIMTDACRRASAARITAVLPYFGYGRQDRKDKPRVPITAKLVADLITAAGVERAGAFAKRLDVSLGIIDKRRDREKKNVAKVMHIVGDVIGRDVLVVDDMVDTAGTLVESTTALLRAGARRVYAGATHAVLSGPAMQRLAASDLEQLVVTDTIPLGAKAQAWDRIKVLSVAPLLGEAIKRIHC